VTPLPYACVRGQQSPVAVARRGAGRVGGYKGAAPRL